jgi:ubiquinone/menaquinone biosynthesis C-methylase UbiE
MNVFKDPGTANNYDAYYQTDFGKKVDEIEKSLMRKMIENIPRIPMLEVGCGTGHWSAFFLEEGFNVTGVDSSEPMLNVAREKDLKAEFLLADALQLPFDTNVFEVVASITMLEFVEDHEKAFSEMFRILKPGGWLILGCLNAHSVLAQRKDQDATFKQAKFMTAQALKEKLNYIGTPKLDLGVFLSEDLKILDNTNGLHAVEPVFIAAIVQKTK